MSTGSQPPNNDLSHADAVEILNEWGSKGFFRKRKLGKSTYIQKIENSPCYIIRGGTQYENRQLTRGYEPYFGGEIDDKSPSPNMWDIKVKRPLNKFVNAVTEIKVPHSEKVTTCDDCLGAANVACSSCGGGGELHCSYCGGSGSNGCSGCGGSGGMLQTVYTTVVSHPDGNTHQEPRTEYVTCSGCGGAGRFTCNGCHGTGLVDCSTCRGCGTLECVMCQAQGRLKKYKLLIVTFEAQTNSQSIGAVEIDEDELLKVTGSDVLNKFDDQIIELDELNDDRKLQNHALEFLETFSNPQSRILFQALNITKIPVFKVTYKKRFGGKEKHLWIYGNEREIYFEGQGKVLGRAREGQKVNIIQAILIMIGFGLISLIMGNVVVNLYKDWSRQTKWAVQDYCNSNFNIENRRLALNLDWSRWDYWRNRHFQALYPNINVDWDNPLHKKYMKSMCDLDNQWLGELERKIYLSEEKPDLNNQSPSNSYLLEAKTYCNNLHIKDRLLKSKIELYKYAIHNNSVFLKKYPEFKGINYYKKVRANPTYLTAWCDIADQWITEQENEGSTTTKKPVYADVKQNGLLDGDFMDAQGYCERKHLTDRLLMADISNDTYIKEVDKAFKSKYPDLQGSINRSNRENIPYIKGWCDIADQWIAEQEDLNLSGGES